MKHKEISQAHFIRDLRSDKGWTRKQLADQLGVDRSTVTRWENDQTKPNSSQQAAISKLRGKEATVDVEFASNRANKSAESVPRQVFAKRFGKTTKALQFKVTDR